MFDPSPYLFSDRMFFIGIALLVNWLIGCNALRILGIFNSGRFLQKLLKGFEQKLNRQSRSQSERTARGAIVLVVMILLSGFVAAQISALTAVHHLGWIAEAAILALFIPQREIWEEGRSVLRLLKEHKLDEARAITQRLSLRETHHLDEHAVIRAIGEQTASGFADRVLSPIFWYILLGLPGFLACKIVTHAAQLVGYDSKRYQAYGVAAMRGAQIFHAIPILLSGWLISLSACFTPKANPARAIITMSRDANKIHAPLHGMPVAAVAGAMGISLGGPRNVQGHLVKDEWVGKGSAKIPLAVLTKILLLYAIACLLTLALIATLLVFLP